MISKCNCKSDFQDQKYGKGNRVFNPCFKDYMRCTICEAKVLKKHDISEPKKK